jgi:P4 family phage/plasmid primase-like protien
MANNAVYEAALKYIERGWHVLPVLSGGKRPLLSNGFHGSSTDPAQIKEWFDGTDHNIGVRCGDASKLLVLDFDEDKMDDDARAFMASVQSLSNTYVVKSGRDGGGTHYYFNLPKDVDLPGKLYSGIDVKSDGYVVAPPSLHSSGRPYTVANDKPVTDLPKWVFERLVESVSGPATKSFERKAPHRAGRTVYDGEGRETFLVATAGAMQKNGTLTLEGLDAINQRDCVPPKSFQDIERIYRSVSRYPVDNPVEPLQLDYKATPTDIALAFLEENALSSALKYWGKTFYRWDGQAYREYLREDLEPRIAGWLMNKGPLKRTVGGGLISDVLTNLSGKAHVDSKGKVPFWLDGRSGEFIAMDNGLIDKDALVDGKVVAPIEHTPDYFNFSCLPYKYDPTATCPTFLSFLEKVQPDPEVRNLLQEWFGYNLVWDTSFATFALFEGEGANGKTVCCVILRALVGDANCSHVGLEAFNSERTFPLAATAGKLANIVEELNEVDKVQEGLLKQFTAGGAMTVERKNRDPFTLIPTARLTFATNNLPRFTDRSQGIWRRMIYVPFRTTIEKKDQDRRFLRADFWQAELPGIFNWAIQGLQRLYAQRYFTEPDSCRVAKASYQQETNPARTFLLDHYEEYPGGKVSRKAMFNAYKEWAREHGATELGAVNFGREVKRTFKGVGSDGDALVTMPDGARDRVWSGLRVKEPETPRHGKRVAE